jgi:hypothetical protein
MVIPAQANTSRGGTTQPMPVSLPVRAAVVDPVYVPLGQNEGARTSACPCVRSGSPDGRRVSGQGSTSGTRRPLHVWRPSSPVVDVAAVSKPHNHYQQHIFVHGVDDAVVADADA